MRRLSYLLATALFWAGPQLDASAAHDRLPAVGTFVYCGTPIGGDRPAATVASGFASGGETFR